MSLRAILKQLDVLERDLLDIRLLIIAEIKRNPHRDDLIQELVKTLPKIGAKNDDEWVRTLPGEVKEALQKGIKSGAFREPTKPRR